MRENNGRAAPLLQRWLAGRSDSERATLARLWSLPEAAARSPEALATALLRPDSLAHVLAALLRKVRSLAKPTP